MNYSILADLVAFFHAVLTAMIFLPLVSWLIGCTIPLWLAVVCLLAAAASITSYLFLRDCFINPLERRLRTLAREDAFRGSFVAHHVHRLTGVRLSRRAVFFLLLISGLSAGASVISHFIRFRA